MPVFVRTIIFSIFIPGTVTVLVPQLVYRNFHELVTIDLGWFAKLGWLLIAAGIAIYLRCAADFTFKGRGTPLPTDPPVKLVSDGLYRYSRNPMYVGVLLILFGEVVLMASTVVLLFSLLMFLLFQSFIVLYEEPHLRGQFGDEYVLYCESVSRWIGRSGS